MKILEEAVHVIVTGAVMATIVGVLSYGVYLLALKILLLIPMI